MMETAEAMLDMIKAAIEAVTSPVDFSEFPINFEDVAGLMLDQQSTALPCITVSNEQPLVENATSTGSIRVSYPVAVAVHFTLTESARSIEREKALKRYEAAARKVALNVGLAHMAGSTECEIDETSIRQRSSTDSFSGLCNTTINFTISFDEGV